MVYVPPSATDTYHSTLCAFVKELVWLNQPLILLGDFNYPDVSWDSLCTESHKSKQLCDMIFECNLTQLVSSLTHVKGNILDLFFTSDENLVTLVKVHQKDESLLHSDHFKLTFRLPGSSSPTACNSPSIVRI